jgi:hypothetical protein
MDETQVQQAAAKLGVSILSPEEEECLVKQAELAELEKKVLEAQTDLSSLQEDLLAFQEEYRRVVAPCFAEMEQLRIDAEAAKSAAESDEDVTCPSAQQGSCEPGEFKTLFREVAKTIHPDLASNDEERHRRHEAMMHANAAYANGNPEQLRELLLRWKADPNAIQGDDVAARLIRTIRMIARAKNQIAEIREEMKEIRQSDAYFLKQRAERATAEGRDFLGDMRANLERQIQQQRARVAEMQEHARAVHQHEKHAAHSPAATTA